MGNWCDKTKINEVVDCIQQLQQVEVTLGKLIDKYEKQIREQKLKARQKMNNKNDCIRHVRTIRIIKHHKGNLENRLEACMSRRYHLESLNVTKMHIKAIQTTSAAFRHFLKRHDVEKVAEIKDTLEEMIEDACEINDIVARDSFSVDDSEIEDDYKKMLAEIQHPWDSREKKSESDDIVFPQVPFPQVPVWNIGCDIGENVELIPVINDNE
jgi:hypothetical protein